MSSERGQMNKQLQKGKFKSFQTFSALPREVLMRFKDAILSEALRKKYSADCITYEENTIKPYKDTICLLRALYLCSAERGT